MYLRAYFYCPLVCVVEAGEAEAVDNPLHDAAKRGNLTFLGECIANSVPVNSLDKAGSTPLHWASRGGHVECVRALLAASGDVSHQNKLGDTALHGAAWKSQVAIIELLLEAGADRSVVNEEGESPYQLAQDPQAQSLLMVRGGGRPVTVDDDYGDSDEGEPE